LAHHNDPIPDLRKLRDSIPDQLQAVFSKMVAKRIGDRYQTMSEVVAELEKCQAGLTSAESSSTSIWKPSPSDQSSEMSPIIQHQSLRSINNGDLFAVESKKKPKPRPSRPVLIGLVVIGLLLGGGSARVIFSRKAKDGTLIVDVDQPDAMVQVLDEEGKVEISQPDVKGAISISVNPGEHRLKVQKEGFIVITRHFQIESGGQLVVKARLLPLNLVAQVPRTLPDMMAPTIKLPAEISLQVDPDRRAAEWVLSVGGTVRISANGSNLDLPLRSPLPQGRFELVGVKLEKLRLHDSDLQHLTVLTHITTLSLAETTTLKDDGLELIAEIRSLTTLYLNGLPVTDQGLKYLERLAMLQSVFLSQTKVTPAGVAALRKALPKCKIEWDEPAASGPK
jgi:hypothetical protein